MYCVFISYRYFIYFLYFVEYMTECKMCNKSMTLQQVVEAADPEIDMALCRRHLVQVHVEISK